MNINGVPVETRALWGSVYAPAAALATAMGLHATALGNGYASLTSPAGDSIVVPCRQVDGAAWCRAGEVYVARRKLLANRA